jgi:3-polyprenyl-4-hydroxybenzoate decarboxylase
VYATPSSGGNFNVRVALKQRVPGEARNAIATVFGCLANVKNVFVVDADVDVFSDAEMDWALATRFQPDRDFVVQSGMRTLPLDPSLGAGARGGRKAGFDLTLPFGRSGMESLIPAVPTYEGRRFPSVRAALEDGPKRFEELIAATGTRDGRDVVRALEALRVESPLGRDAAGRYLLE